MSTPLAAMHLADGPAMYFGGTIMTFALPLGAFIVIATVLFYLFRSSHSSPKLKYLTDAPFASVGTREPGPAPAVVAETVAQPETSAAPEATIVVPAEDAATETTEGKGGGE